MEILPLDEKIAYRKASKGRNKEERIQLFRRYRDFYNPLCGWQKICERLF